MVRHDAPRPLRLPLWRGVRAVRGVVGARAGVPRMSKYHAQPTLVDGIIFDSKGEATRYGQLKLLQQAGAITGLRLQVRYPLVVNDYKIGVYVADFVYCENGHEVTEDFKGIRTPVYRLKRKLMAALYGIEIRETGA